MIDEKLLVASIEDMDRYTFCRHFTKRHRDSLGGMQELLPHIDEGIEAAYRSFHRRLHRLRVDLPHEHDDE